MTTSLPEGYKPFPELRLCSNTLLGSPIPILVGSFPALLIGIGAAPLVWLAAPTGPTPSAAWKYIVEASKSMHPAVRVDVDLLAQSVAVLIRGTIILEVRNQSQELAEVSRLDLRLVGLNVHGDSNGMFVGTNSFIGNTFKGTGAMFAISTTPAPVAAAQGT
jgi:hypothetical protein